MTEERKLRLCKEWHRLTREMEKARNADNVGLANSYENSLCRIEEQLMRDDIDPVDYSEG